VSVVAITGPSRGIGRATTLALAARGSDLALFGRRSTALNETRDLARLHARRVEVIDCELTSPDSIARAAERCVEMFGAPVAVVHNAAIIRRALVQDTTLEQWEEQFGVNLRAPFLLTRALLPSMLSARSGRMLYVASISSTLGSARAAAYVATKWGLVGFMKSLAEELSGSGLMACAVLPGSVATEMLKDSGFVARMRPEDVAQTLVHYALDAPLSHNGAVIEMFGI
jgi:3-oxoacyl-[acyl-carrier protein] reductase